MADISIMHPIKPLSLDGPIGSSSSTPYHHLQTSSSSNKHYGLPKQESSRAGNWPQIMDPHAGLESPENNREVDNSYAEGSSESGEKKYQCNHCSLKFTRNSSLKRHVKSKHLLLKYKCDICPNYYNKRKDYLQRHMFIKHGMDRDEFNRKNYTQDYVYEDASQRILHRRNMSLNVSDSGSLLRITEAGPVMEHDFDATGLPRDSVSTTMSDPTYLYPNSMHTTETSDLSYHQVNPSQNMDILSLQQKLQTQMHDHQYYSQMKQQQKLPQLEFFAVPQQAQNPYYYYQPPMIVPQQSRLNYTDSTLGTGIVNQGSNLDPNAMNNAQQQLQFSRSHSMNLSPAYTNTQLPHTQPQQHQQVHQQGGNLQQQQGNSNNPLPFMQPFPYPKSQ